MKKFDLRTPIIYVLTFIIIILLIVMKKMDDDKKEQVLEEKMAVVEKKRKEKEELDITFPQKPKPNIKGIIGLVIDDFGYRNDEISDGFLELDARLTYAVFQGIGIVHHLDKKLLSQDMRLLYTCQWKIQERLMVKKNLF